MLLKCPCCNASFSLEAALAVDAGRSALAAALQMPALGGLLGFYLGMFRSKGRALAFTRAEKLLAEIKPMLDEQVVRRDGLTRRCPHALWQQGLQRMVELRDAGTLRLPLESHGYLLKVVFDLADHVGAQEEKAVESARRSGAARDQGTQRMERFTAISRIRGDVQLGLMTREQAIEALRELGLGPEALNG